MISTAIVVDGIFGCTDLIRLDFHVGQVNRELVAEGGVTMASAWRIYACFAGGFSTTSCVWHCHTRYW